MIVWVSEVMRDVWRSLFQLFQLFINDHKFYRKQYPLPAVSRLASRGEQWLHVGNTYTDRSQERLQKKSS